MPTVMTPGKIGFSFTARNCCFALGNGRALSDAEDVVQEAFVRFWRHQRGLPGEPMALLVTSVRRAAFDLARRESRRTAREERAAEPADNRSPIFDAALEIGR